MAAKKVHIYENLREESNAVKYDARRGYDMLGGGVHSIIMMMCQMNEVNCVWGTTNVSVKGI